MAHSAPIRKYCGDRERCFIFTLKPYAHIPGYTGHCPFLRDTVGETFSAATWAAHIIRQSQHPSRPASALPRLEHQEKTEPPALINYPSYKHTGDDLPEDGVHRSVYKIEAEDAIKTTELEKEIMSLPRLTSATVHHSNWWDGLDRIKNFYVRSSLGSGKVHFSTPIIGYGGHVPRLQVTSAGLGMRFSEAARFSLALFQREMTENCTRRRQTSAGSMPHHHHHHSTKHFHRDFDGSVITQN